MTISKYIKDNLAKYFIYLIQILLILSILVAFKVNSSAIICIVVVLFLSGVLLFFYDFWRKKSFYGKLNKTIQNLDKKYLSTEIVEPPYFLEGQIFYDAIRQINKAMIEEIGVYRRQTDNFRDYIELWVHEIKTPLSGLTLSLRSENRNQKIFLDEMENYIDQALFYSKVDTIDKDYVIKTISLEKTINSVIRRNKDSLIMHNIKIVIEKQKYSVHSDPKWLEFIINQIILNSIKYRADNPEIKISTEKTKDQITLKIRDNGIGIKKSELKHVTEKGFTGNNDRKTKTSTGMGLYIANQLAKDLGHKISVNSKEGEYTEVEILFCDHNFYLTKT